MSHDPDHAPFQGWLDVSRLGLATFNPQTKFEVSNYTHFEDMSSGAKCINWSSLGHLGLSRSSAMSPLDRAHTTSYSTFFRNHASILYRFGDIAGYLSDVADFDPPHLHLAPP